MPTPHRDAPRPHPILRPTLQRPAAARERRPVAAGLLVLLLAGLLAGPVAARQGASAAADGPLAAFGVVGDGRADDTAALQRALDALGDLQLERGRYRITRPLVVELDRLGPFSLIAAGGATLVMEGPGPALHLVGTHAGTAAPASVQPNVWERQRSPRIEGLEIVGGHPEADGIRIEGTMQPTLSRLTIRRTRHAVHLTGRNRNVLISDVHLYENRGIGVYLDRVNLHQINIIGSHISYNGGGGIVVRGGEVRNLQIGTSDIEGNMDPEGPPTANILIDVQDGTIREGAIVGCTIQHTSRAPGSANIRIVGRADDPPRAAGRFTIADNAMSDAVVNIHLQYARGITITGNTLWEGQDYNLLVEHSAHILVANTLFERNPDYPPGAANGLLFRDSRDVSLTGLHLHRTQAEGGGLVLQRCEGFNLTNLQILETKGAGILLEDVSYTRLSDSIIRAAGPDPRRGLALRLTSGRGNLIVDNLLIGRVDVAPGTARTEGNRSEE